MSSGNLAHGSDNKCTNGIAKGVHSVFGGNVIHPSEVHMFVRNWLSSTAAFPICLIVSANARLRLNECGVRVHLTLAAFAGRFAADRTHPGASAVQVVYRASKTGLDLLTMRMRAVCAGRA